MYGEEDSNKYIRPLREREPSTYPDFLNIKLQQFEEGTGFFWTVRDRQGLFLGTANLNFFEPLQVRHCGVHLARAAWGKGYATEILLGIQQWAKSKGENELNALVEMGNIASMKMLEKAGFTLVEQRELNGDQLAIYKCEL